MSCHNFIVPGALRSSFWFFPAASIIYTRTVRLTMRTINSVLFAAVVAITVLLNCQRASEQQPRASSDSSRVNPAPPAITHSTLKVKKGDTFGAILSQAGCAVQEQVRCLKAIVHVKDFKLYPGDSVIVSRHSSGALAQISILSANTFWYVFDMLDSLALFQKKPAKLDTLQCFARATIQNSLTGAMDAMGIGNGFVHAFVDLFAWDIDFFSDPQPGDTITALYEELFMDGRFIGYGAILAAQYQSKNHNLLAIGIRDTLGRIAYYDAKGKPMRKLFLRAPLDYARISSGFSWSRLHPIYGYRRAHTGVDYAAPAGTPVYSVAVGTVISAGTNGGYGRQVKIRHTNGYQTWYAHLQAIKAGISPGRRVAQQEVIGYVGSSGVSTGPHVDFRMLSGSRFVNPRTQSPVVDKSQQAVAAELFGGFKQNALTIFGRFNSRPCARYPLDSAVYAGRNGLARDTMRIN
jgi:murein DD-endopeptidase MepM/ murein hydrolase activator NlpD